jgi:hypothetical protein
MLGVTGLNSLEVILSDPRFSGCLFQAGAQLLAFMAEHITRSGGDEFILRFYVHVLFLIFAASAEPGN